MRSFACVSVVVYVARKLRPCPSYSRRRDRINLVLWRSLDKGGGVFPFAALDNQNWWFGAQISKTCFFHLSGILFFSYGVQPVPSAMPLVWPTCYRSNASMSAIRQKRRAWRG